MTTAKIASVLAVAPSAYHPSGLAVWLRHVAASIEGSRRKVTVAITTGAWHDARAYMDLYPELRYYPLVNSTGTREGRVQAIHAALRRVQPDMVLCANIPDTYLAVNRYRLASGSKIYVTMTCHNLSPQIFADAAAYRDVVDAVICVNRLTQAMMPALSKIDEARSFYVPCGAAPANAMGRSIPSGRERRSHPPLKIAWVGRFEEHDKCVGSVVPIIQELEAVGVPYEFWMVGSGSEEQSLRAALRSFTERGKVLWLGSVNPDKITERVFQEVDVLLVTSRNEVSPLVVWEAMANSVAVVTSRWTGLECEEAFHHGVNCLTFPVGDYKKAVDALSLLTDEGTRRRIARSGLELQSERYSWSAVGSALAKAFACIASRPPRRALAKDPGCNPVSGRLDALLGPYGAEMVRRALKRRFLHTSAGSEWPWANHAGLPYEGFLSAARDLEQRLVRPRPDSACQTP